MSDLFIPSDSDLLDPQESPSSPARRRIAQALGDMAEREIFAASVNKKVPYMTYMAQMMWDLITGGEMIFSDGSSLKISSVDEWMKAVRFVAGHLDGPTAANSELALNIFKVYMGVDPNQV